MLRNLYKIPEYVSVDMDILDKVIDIYIGKIQRQPGFLLTDIIRAVCRTPIEEIDEIYKSYKAFVKYNPVNLVKVLVNPLDTDLDQKKFINICKQMKISAKSMMCAFVYYIYRHGDTKYKEIQKWKINSK